MKSWTDGAVEKKDIVEELFYHCRTTTGGISEGQIYKEIHDTLDMNKGSYSDYGCAGSFQLNGIEYNLILNEREAKRIAIEIVKQDLEDFFKIPFININYSEAAENAVNIDGWPHFISRYDRSYEETENGLIIFRE